jgi:hypothetical protein
MCEAVIRRYIARTLARIHTVYNVCAGMSLCMINSENLNSDPIRGADFTARASHNDWPWYGTNYNSLQRTLIVSRPIREWMGKLYLY